MRLVSFLGIHLLDETYNFLIKVMFARLNSSYGSLSGSLLGWLDKYILVGIRVGRSVDLAEVPVNAILVKAVEIGSFLRPLIIVRSVGTII